MDEVASSRQTYFIWRCPECGRQYTPSDLRPRCHGRSCERIPVVPVERGLSDEAVERAAKAMGGYSPDQWARWQETLTAQRWLGLARSALLAAGPRSGIEFTEDERRVLLWAVDTRIRRNDQNGWPVDDPVRLGLLSARAKIEAAGQRQPTESEVRP